MNTWHSVVTYLVYLGVPGTLATAFGSVWNARRKKKALEAAAPDLKIDTSMARMQQAAIMQDTVIDNLNEQLDRAGKRADLAESRVAAAQAANDALHQQLINRTNELRHAEAERDRALEQINNRPPR